MDAGIPDLRQPISAKSIRGQLRFWWRATRAAQFKSVAEMKAFEDWMFGCAAQDGKKDDTKETRLAQSRVQIVVHVKPATEKDLVQAFDQNNRYKPTGKVPDYIAFPLNPSEQEQKQGKSPKPVLGRCEFSLVIYFRHAEKDGKKLEVELAAAFWAWETFGGVGARTRRGFGAIERTDIKIASWQNHIQQGFKNHVVSGTAPATVPYLLPKYKVINKSWAELIKKYKTFRQGTPNDRKALGWTEAKNIRGIMQNRAAKRLLFARGQMGMPIIFHFKDAPRGQTPEPKDTILNPIEKERLASPIILRPLDQNNSVAVLLESNLQIQKAQLRRKDDKKLLAEVELQPTASEANSIRPLNDNTNLLEALLDYLARR